MAIEQAAFHGGQFWTGIGTDFTGLGKLAAIDPADVLDAWFAPAPNVLAALHENLEICARCSPPVDGDGLIRALSNSRGIDSESIVLGAGSSALIFLALRHWLKPYSKVLILDPMYGEYAHVLENVIGCSTDTLALKRSEEYRVDLNELVLRGGDYDWIILVNPNSPTGQYIDGQELAAALNAIPRTTSIWVDEAYVEYVGTEHSLESFAAGRDNVVVCKTMSKSYALSGLRVAYLVCSSERANELKTVSPPWAISLPAQIAAVTALQSPEYYELRYAQTRQYRQELAANLAAIGGFDVFAGATNSLILHFGEPVSPMVELCKQQGVYLRDTASMFRKSNGHAVRIAVRSPEENRRIAVALIQARDQVRINRPLVV